MPTDQRQFFFFFFTFFLCLSAPFFGCVPVSRIMKSGVDDSDECVAPTIDSMLIITYPCGRYYSHIVQCPWSLLGKVGQDPSVSKSKRKEKKR